jgi:hypothetical protein
MLVDNRKIGLKETDLDGENRINVAQDTEKLWAVVSKVMNSRILSNKNNRLNS